LTVIAYRDGIMAADGSVWSDDVVTCLSERKIKRSSDGSMYACTGARSDIQAFYEWVDSGRTGDRPKPKEAFGCIFVEPTGRVIKYYGEMPGYESPGPWAVDGASREFMCALMLTGHSAEETIRLAIKHTPWAAGEIQIEKLGESH
jgi:hypothetical protein